MNRLLAALVGLALAFPAGHALAQSAPPDAGATVISLTEHVERLLPRDRLRAELRAEAVNADARKLQEEINRRMAAALDRAKQAPEVKAETAGYNVYQERSGPNGPLHWRGSQALRLTAGDFSALLGLVGALQEQGLVLSNLTAELSPEAAAAVQDDLTAQAIAQLKSRAERVAAGLGMRVGRYQELHVGNAAVSNPVPRLFMAASAGAAPPVAEGGDATVSLDVAATIVLAPAPR